MVALTYKKGHYIRIKMKSSTFTTNLPILTSCVTIVNVSKKLWIGERNV